MGDDDPEDHTQGPPHMHVADREFRTLIGIEICQANCTKMEAFATSANVVSLRKVVKIGVSVEPAPRELRSSSMTQTGAELLISKARLAFLKCANW